MLFGTARCGIVDASDEPTFLKPLPLFDPRYSQNAFHCPYSVSPVVLS